jgi:hypothetical protein
VRVCVRESVCEIPVKAAGRRCSRHDVDGFQCTIERSVGPSSELRTASGGGGARDWAELLGLARSSRLTALLLLRWLLLRLRPWAQQKEEGGGSFWRRGGVEALAKRANLGWNVRDRPIDARTSPRDVPMLAPEEAGKATQGNASRAKERRGRKKSRKQRGKERPKCLQRKEKKRQPNKMKKKKSAKPNKKKIHRDDPHEHERRILERKKMF